MLSQLSAVLVCAEERTGAINKRCTSLRTECTTLYAVDFFVHADFTSTVLEFNALPSLTWLPDMPVWSNIMVGYLRLSGAGAGTRVPYLPAFKAAVRELCLPNPQQCTKRTVQGALQLSESNWGLGVLGFRLLYPPAPRRSGWLGLSKTMLRDLGHEGVEELRWTQEFLRTMRKLGNGTFINRPKLSMRRFVLQDLAKHVFRWSAESGDWMLSRKMAPESVSRVPKSRL